ncbi:hypothetical protein HKX48_009041 [Thoreauomyces humboldtii]|nr:hypothetical protein HKX48_009041 [Thoreauomyces humboldtii]
MVLGAAYIAATDPGVQRREVVDGEGGLFCRICQCFITPDARHCRECDKCVERMDHHCYFLNTCIGRKNYKTFVFSLVATEVYALGVVVASVVVSASGDNDVYMRRMVGHTGLSTAGIRAIAAVHLAIGVAAAGYVAYLLHLHWIIYRRGMTTLEYSHWLRHRRIVTPAAVDVVTLVGDENGSGDVQLKKDKLAAEAAKVEVLVSDSQHEKT